MQISTRPLSPKLRPTPSPEGPVHGAPAVNRIKPPWPHHQLPPRPVERYAMAAAHPHRRPRAIRLLVFGGGSAGGEGQEICCPLCRIPALGESLQCL
jgi:hypothetical protein